MCGGKRAPISRAQRCWGSPCSSMSGGGLAQPWWVAKNAADSGAIDVCEVIAVVITNILEIEDPAKRRVAVGVVRLAIDQIGLSATTGDRRGPIIYAVVIAVATLADPRTGIRCSDQDIEQPITVHIASRHD